MNETINTNLKKPFNLYITDAELNELKRETKELEKIIGKKLTISKYIRLKLKLDQNGF